MADIMEEVFIIQELKEEADQDLKDQKYREAVMKYTRALGCSPIEWMIICIPELVAEILVRRAECYFKLEDFTKTSEDCRTVIDLKSLDPSCEDLISALYLDANARLAQNTLFSALVPAVWLSYLKPKAKKVVTTWQRLKDGLQILFIKDKGNENKALSTLMNFGITIFQTDKNTTLAFHIFTETIKLFDLLFLPCTHFYRAHCSLKMGQVQDAHEDCSRVLTHAPDDENARKLMAEIQKCMKQTERPQRKPPKSQACQVANDVACAAAVSEGDKNLPETEIMLRHLKREADKRLKNEHYKEAIGMYAHILRSLPASQGDSDLITNIFCKIAECYIKLGQFAEALEHSNHAIRLDVETGDNGHLFVSLYLHMKSLEGLGQVLGAYKEAIDLGYMKPETPKIKTATQKLRQKLQDQFKQVRGSEDDTRNHLMEFGIKTFSMGKPELASLIFTETMNLFHPQFIAGALLCRARCFLEMDHLDDAHLDCMKVLHNHPSSKEALDLKRKIQRLKGTRPYAINKKPKENTDGETRNGPLAIQTKRPSHKNENAKKDDSAKESKHPPVVRADTPEEHLKRSTDSFGVASEMENYELEESEEPIAVDQDSVHVTETPEIFVPVPAEEEKETEVSTLAPDTDPIQMEQEPAKTKKKTKQEPQLNKETKEATTEGEKAEDKEELQGRGESRGQGRFAGKGRKQRTRKICREGEKAEDKEDLQQQEAYHKCLDSLDSNEGTSKKAKKKKKKKKRTIQQEDDTKGTDDPLSETCSQGTLSAASSVSNLSMASSASAAWNPQRSTPDAQLGVHIVCEHFFHDNHKRPASLFYSRKYCKYCENRSDLRYAFWCRKKNQWQVLRPYSKGILGAFLQCKHYLVNRPCGRTPCTFAHGADELEIWTAQRKRDDTRSRPSNADDLFVDNSMSNLKKSSSVCDLRETPDLRKVATHKGGHYTYTPPDGQTRASQVSTAGPSSKDDSWTVVTSIKTTSKPVPAIGNQTTQTYHSTYSSHATGGTYAQITSHLTSSGDFSAPNFRLHGGPTASTIGPSVWSSGTPTIQPQQRSALSAPETGLTWVRNGALPLGVYLLCAHFLQKHMTRSASVYDKNKVCKSCENRSKAHYALWCDKKKSWRLPRARPADVKAAFQLCKHFTVGERCRKDPCTFAHGQAELLYWTMERQGALQPPSTRLQAQIANTGGRLTMQHLNQYQHRSPPPGVFNGAYRMCKWVCAGRVCRYGRACLFAHRQDELNSWKEEHEKKKNKKSKENAEEDFPVQCVEEITRGSESELVDSMKGVSIECTPAEHHVTLHNNGDQHTWKFCLTYKPAEIGHLRYVRLLYRYHHCYKLTEVRVGHFVAKQNHETYTVDFTAKPDGFSHKAPPHQIEGRAQIDVTVAFSAPVFGTFAQCILFDFGKKPHLVQRLNVDVCGKDVSDKLLAIRHEMGEQYQRWDENTIEVVRVVSTALQEDRIRKRYTLPKDLENIVSAQVMTGEAEKGHYKQNMHQLLFIEETYMNQKVGRYNLQGASLHAQRSVFEELAGMRWAAEGELYGILHLDLPITPDDTAGRLFVRNVCAVWLKPAVTDGALSRRVYEAQVEKVEVDSVVLKLSARICAEFQLYDTCDSLVDAQFQLNREPLCEMHAAIDNVGPGQLRLLFPDPVASQIASPEFDIRCSWTLQGCLNDQQRTIIKAIVSPGRNSPALVVFGPFGTGKTFVLSQAVRQLVQDRSNRVLLCTHSNKAADIHVELLDDYLKKENGILAATPLRVYQPMRKFEATSEKARKYCLVNNREFVLPTRQHVIKHHVVITTLVTSRVLLNLQLHHGIFTHILVDEAAQALESEAIIPLALAGPNTKVVLTGDHMQMCPEVYSSYAKEWGLQRSLPERLFDHYEATQDEAFKNAHVMFLTENYRSHEEILKFPSENFYGGKLIARGHEQQLAHPRLGPLVFYTARGIEQSDQDHSFMNLSEVSEVVKRVGELAADWPAEWGMIDLSEIAVLSAYKFQVKAIRNQFRKMNLGMLRDVTVDTIHNVQGQEFRAVFISTVRTLNTCKKNSETAPESAETYHLEFLSDPKLLNTAVTRARSLVAVVGDPISLCTVGHCRGVWRDYIKRCDVSSALHGTTMEELDKEIFEYVKSIPLNPDAVSFLPKSAETPEHGQLTEETIEEEQQSSELEGNEDHSSVADRDDTEEAKTGDTSEKGSDSPSNEDDGDDDLDSVSYEDFQGENLEDATVFPRYMDEIIKALISKCEERQTKDSLRKSMFPEAEFPSLRQANLTSKVKQPQHPASERRATGPVEWAERCPGDYDMVTINGRVEIHLVNLGFQQTPSVQARRLLVSTRPQECLQPEVLRRLLHNEPERYLACTLRLNPERGRLAFAEIQDTSTPDIEITGRVRQAFDKDTVVIELIREEGSIRGKVIGTLEHIISPHERQYVCTAEYDNPSLLRPLNKSVTKIVNMSSKDCKDMPVYKRKRNNQVIKVHMFERKKVLSGQYLFAVQYLQWRPDCTHPLGIVVKPLSIGNTAEDSLKIAYAEHGVRTSFHGAEIEARKSFPPSWTVPADELHSRRKVSTAFTIDPPESRDLDDALSVETAPDLMYRVGIHIADVSYFVQPGRAVNREADQRCTSYYPKYGQESIAMIPHALSEAHCSLLPHQDRLAVSLFLCLDNEGEVVGQPEVCRTIVNSCCRLNYSQAQKIIDQQKLERDEFPEKAVTGVRILNAIAQNKRRTRLGDGADAGYDGDIKEDFEAHELVQEMMILANKTIAEYLVSAIPHLAPLRTQLPPKKHRMAEWLQKHGQYLQYLHANHRCMNVVIPDPGPAAKTLKIHQGAWSGICKAAEEGDMAKLTRLVCDEDSQPQLSTAHAQFRRMQARARYVCAGDQPEENKFHYSLGVPNYTHFTSPIRRYADILVHRLVLEIVQGRNVEDSFSEEEIARICRRCTFYQANARKFGKTCRKIQLAKLLKNVNQEICAIVESIEEGCVILHIAAAEHDLLGGREKQLKISLLNPIDQSHPEGEGAQCIELKLRFRMYYAPRESAILRKKLPEYKEGENTEHIPTAEIKAMLSDDLTNAYDPVDIPGEKWLEMLTAVKSGDAPHLNTLIRPLIRDPRTAQGARTALQAKRQLVQANRGGAVYQHPHHGEKATGTADEGHFYDKSLLIKQYDPLHVQLMCHTIKGVISPDIQLLKLTSQVNICLEHQKYPCDCFATTARHNATRIKYYSLEEYVNAWTPVLAMEAATEAVSENDSFTIAKLGVCWEIVEGKTVGRATLPVGYCTSRQLEIFPGDLICIRVRYEDCGGPETKAAVGKTVPVVDASVKHPESRKSRCDEAEKNVRYASNPTDYWVGHCVLEECEIDEKMPQVQPLKFRLHQTSSNVPQGLYDGKTHASTFELIHRTLPQRRMYDSLSLVPGASNLVCAICQGQEQKKADFGKPPAQLSLSRHYPKSKFKELNSYQETAVRAALGNPLTIIQGPPGTGKTVTGVHIAYWFARRNKELKPEQVASDDDAETEEGHKAPPQVLYCGPSNKSVDVVAEYLLRETDLKVLRVCSAQYEQHEFPIPNKLKPVRATRSAQEMLILSPAVLEVCLHRVIRAPESPFAKGLKEMEDMFEEDKERGVRTSDECVADYRKLIFAAEVWAIQGRDVQIILCTCAVAGSPRIEFACDNIMQCIVDECGMCLEPETLIPITRQNIKQIVLVGDHKQLQPVIKNNVAKHLGLEISMFERLSKWATMLQRQYRMHEAICEFPSRQFYDGKLETDNSVKSRVPDKVNWWPAQQLQKDWPVVFCHVEGKEETTFFKTAQSSEQSKSNMKEVNKAVYLAKCLVNRYSIDKRNVVILSPYRDQRSKISEKLKGAYEEIEVTTFTKSQGSEWDYVILSLVRSLPEHEIDPDPSTHWLRGKLGFVTDHHQINVALTRARRGMCIIGNKNLLRVESMWGALLEHYDQHECVVDESWPWA